MQIDNFQPRNSGVLVRLFKQKETKVGALTIPADNKEYAEAEVLAVGPGHVLATGCQSETHDLNPGARVLVAHKKKLQRPGPAGGIETKFQDRGLRLEHQDDQDGEFYLFEQHEIIAVIG